ncbi:MAG: HNH endonuclease [Chloroflexi bacterium]|nr:HNH endonuclease [Chloroflexota bacterium]MBU1748339.1 HNH endonuclease [Chloroflexota bacterium]
MATETYHGKPCRNCGGTERYRSNDVCVLCKVRHNRRYYDTHREKRYQRNREHYQSYREEESRKSHAYYQTHREQIHRKKREWRAANPDKECALHHRRRTRKTEAGGSYTAAQWQALCDHYGNICLWCGRDDRPLFVDHVIPISRGGSSDISNLQCLCGPCNSAKGDKSTDYRPDQGADIPRQLSLF